MKIINKITSYISYIVGLLHKSNAVKDSVKHVLTINYVFDDTGEPAAAAFTGEYKNGDLYEIKSPVISGFSVDSDIISGVMPDSDVTYNVVYSATLHTLTIFYTFIDGSNAAPVYSHEYRYGETYNVTSPVVYGFVANKISVKGIMPNRNLTVTVIYNMVPHEIEDTIL